MNLPGKYASLPNSGSAVLRVAILEARIATIEAVEKIGRRLRVSPKDDAICREIVTQPIGEGDVEAVLVLESGTLALIEAAL